MSSNATTPEWTARALRLWAEGKTVREIAADVGRPIDEVSPFLGQRTWGAVYEATQNRMRAGGYR